MPQRFVRQVERLIRPPTAFTVDVALLPRLGTCSCAKNPFQKRSLYPLEAQNLVDKKLVEFFSFFCIDQVR
jgi:hypothetical protein